MSPACCNRCGCYGPGPVFVKKKRIETVGPCLLDSCLIKRNMSSQVQVSTATESIPFDEIVSGSTVRLAVIDGVQYLSIHDIIKCVCGKNRTRAHEVWERMPENNKDKLDAYLSVYQFRGRGQVEGSVITLPGAIKLVMMLSGRNVERYRVKFAEIISRYLDGDRSLCDEIKHNKAIGKKRSYSKFAQETEASIQEDGVDDKPYFQYIYATKSAAFPGLIKIGRTSDMKARLSQLNTGCAPVPHTLVAIVPTMDMYRDECLAHQFFADERREGEFFEVEECCVKDYFQGVVMPRYLEELHESVKV